MSNVFWCKTCLNMSTRPRIEFNEDKICNACQWSQEKKTFNWDARWKELESLIEKYRSTDGGYDCIVPVSGGKDGSYIAHTLKTKFGLNPLCVTITPALQTDLGRRNLDAFKNSGFDVLQLDLNPSILRELNQIGLVDFGFPYLGWLIAIQTAVIRVSVDMKIPLIFYGEDGEVEYGGSTETKNNPVIDIDYQRRVWFEGHAGLALDRLVKHQKDVLRFFQFPNADELAAANTFITTWSYYEPWDSYRNYLVAKEFCGMEEAGESNAGTFTNFAQNDQLLYPLHVYLMYLKFGFGRATQDVGIEIRRGAMKRAQGLRLVKLYDGLFPSELVSEYCRYYELSKPSLYAAIFKHANKNLFELDEANGSVTRLFNHE